MKEDVIMSQVNYIPESLEENITVIRFNCRGSSCN